MKTPREVAEEVVYDPVEEGDGWHSSIGDDEDYVPLEPQDTEECGRLIVGNARDIIERLVTRERAVAREPLEVLLRGVLGEFYYELARMGRLNELGGPKEANARNWIAKIEAALSEAQ